MISEFVTCFVAGRRSYPAETAATETLFKKGGAS